ncbi:TolC family protein [Pedobacter sp. HMF7647]|uniref:TolC family protein n=1 Tax=Hufsiella arboris TaxID=2695275 RepID=A0A7K1YBJ0_9SPHI|nr:TolC family protein [Hufsiella arboris]MXV51962.1 TolC family protein [Hufsiella arboris]
MKYILNFLLLFLGTLTCFSQQKTLDEYLQQAITNSPLLKDLNNQILSAQLDSVRIRAGFKPQVIASSAGLYAPVVNGYGYSQAITNGQSINGLITVSKSFIGKNYLNAQFAGIGFQQDSLRNNIKLSEQDLRRTIIAQYVTAYGSLQQQAFNQEIVDLLSKEEDLLKRLTRSNVYRQSDYLTFLVTLKQAQLQLSQARLQYKTDYATLNYLSGLADTTVLAIAKPDLQRKIVQRPDNSIFFRQYRLDSLRLDNTRKLIDYSYKPRLSVFGDGGYNSDLTGQYYKNFGASLGFAVSLPIYDGGYRKLQYKKLSLEQDTRRTYQAFFNNQYSQQISQLNQQISDYDQLIGQINDQFKYSESLIKVDTKLLQTGDLKIADLILAINNYLSVRNLLTQNTISRLQLINQLNYWSR